MYGLKRREGDEALQARFAAAIRAGRPTLELLSIAFTLTPNGQNWNLIGSAGDAVDRAYWGRLNVFVVPETEDLEWIAEKFLGVDRGRAVLSFLAGHDKLTVPTELIMKVMRHSSTIQGSSNEADNSDGGMFSWYVGKMFERLDQIEGLEQQVADLEWVYFQALQHSERPARSLQKALAEDPGFFVTLLKALYSSTDDEPELEGEAAERAGNVASQAFHVLEEWRRVPGSDDDGAIDAAKLLAWVRAARAACAAAGRAQIGDYKIGVILSAAKRVSGEAWPPEAVREILEDVANDDIDQGFVIGLYNRRGVTTRFPTDGGGQERSLASVYRADAKASALLWPRTRAVLERIAAGYEADAAREDQSAEQRDW